MFLHGAWLHLILNTWTRWLFGPAVEDRLGTVRRNVFYICSGAFASCAHTAFNPLSISGARRFGRNRQSARRFLLLYRLAGWSFCCRSSSCP
jgi:hypothetical protein